MASSSGAQAQPTAQSSRPHEPGEKGSPASHNNSAQKNSDHQQQASVQPSPPPVEPEDAYLTGTSRSLQRRVLGLNVDGHHAQQHPETPAGQHATGSFPDQSNDG